MSNKILVSVVITTRNRNHYLLEALNSVLNQSFKDYEVVLVDDGSEIPVMKSLENYKSCLRPIRHEISRGASAARNQGIRAARGEWIAFLDDDDRWLPDYLDSQIQFLAENPDTDVLGARCRVIDQDGKIQANRFKPSEIPLWDPVMLLIGKTPVTSSTLVRKAVLEKAGLFREDLRGDEDIHLYVRLSAFARFRFNDTILVEYRQHGENWTSNETRGREGHLRVCEVLRPMVSDLNKDVRFQKHCARTHYLLARDYFAAKMFGKGLYHLTKALKYFPRVGTLFQDVHSPFGFSWFQSLKPYFMFLILLFLVPAEFIRNALLEGASRANRN